MVAQRRMSDGGGTPVYVNYNIQKPTISGTDYITCPGFGAGTDWGSAGGARLDAAPAFLLTGGPRTVNVCFQTTLDQNTADRDLYRHGSGLGHVDLSPDERAGRSEGTLSPRF